MFKTLLILIPALPLIAALVTACFGRWLKERSGWPIIAALAGSFFMSLVLLNEVGSFAYNPSQGSKVGREETVTLWNWFSVADAMPIVSTPGSPAR